MSTTTPAPPPVSRTAYWTLAALFGINLLNFTDRYILGAVLKPIQEPPENGGLGLTDAEGGFIVSAFFLAYALVSPLVMLFGDRVNRKYVLAACIAVWSLATFGAGLANNFAEMVAARVVLAFGEATFTTLAPTVIADLFPRHKRGWAMTVFYLAVPLGAALGYPIAGHIAAIGPGMWRYAFYVVGLPGLIVAVAALALPEPKRGASEDSLPGAPPDRPYAWRETFRALLTTPSFVWNCLGMAAFTFAIGGVQVWAAKYFVESTGQPLDAIDSYLGVVLVISGLGGTALGGWLADRWTRRWPGAYFALSGLGLLLSVPFLLTSLLGTQLLLVFSCLTAGLTLGFLNIGPSNTILANVVRPRMRAAAVAVNLFCIRMLGDIPAPWLMGVVSDATGDLFWGVILAAPALVLGGVFFCLGTPYLARDQEGVKEPLPSA